MSAGPTSRPVPDHGTRLREILTVAAWFGLVTGLVEGLEVPLLDAIGGLTWKVRLTGTSVKLIWVTPVIYLLGFCVSGALLVLIGRWAPRVDLARWAIFGFSALCFLDLSVVSGWIASLGALTLALGVATLLTRRIRSHEEASHRFFRRTLPWLLAATLLAFLGVEGGLRWEEWKATSGLARLPDGTPNVLVIVVDTLRADHLSSYGYKRQTSPNLEQFAKQGVQFDEAFAASSWTLPSHASILTGRPPHEHGAELEKYDGRFPTLAEVLERRGYRTGAFSANIILFTRSQGFGRGFIHFEDYFGSLGDTLNRTLYGRFLQKRLRRLLGFEDIPGRKIAPEITRATLHWIDQDRERPFFAFLNYFDLHDPYLPPQPFRNKFSSVRNPGGRINSHAGRDFPVLTPAQLQAEIDAYDGAVACVDAAIGKLLSELDKRQLTNDTIVVVTADHGEDFGEHRLLGHGNALYWTTIHVPLALRWPSRVPAGVHIEVPVTNQALPATLMELLGMANQRVFPGPSLARLWQDPGEPPDSAWPLAELAKQPCNPTFKVPACLGAMKSLVTSQWHFILHEKFGPALYDWRADPGEEHDLSKTPDGQRVVAEFISRLKQIQGKQTTQQTGFKTSPQSNTPKRGATP